MRVREGGRDPGLRPLARRPRAGSDERLLQAVVELVGDLVGRRRGSAQKRNEIRRVRAFAD